MENMELCFCMLPSGQLVFPIYHEIIADGETVYRGYSNRKAWWEFVRAGQSGAKCVSHLRNGVEMAFSWKLEG